MAFNLSNTWSKLSPRGKQIAAVTTMLGGVLAVIIFITTSNESGTVELKRQQTAAKNDAVVNVLTNNTSKNIGLDVLAGRLKRLDDRASALTRRVEQLYQERAADRRDNAVMREWNEKLEALNNELAKVRAEYRDPNFRRSAPAVITPPKDGTPGETVEIVDDPFQVQDQERMIREGGGYGGGTGGGSGGSGVGNGTGGGNGGATAPGGKGKAAKGGKKLRINVVGQTKSSDDEAAERAAQAEAQARAEAKATFTIPAGSVVTGTIITGADYPTGKGSYDNPTPMMIRITKNALLPNRFRSDFRGCVMLASGRGDLSTSRAMLRTETLSCLRNDGAIINANVSGYLSGEDGKAGIKGRVVSKQGQYIAKTLVAGFLSGMSEAFDYSPVSVLSTSASNSVQYQRNWSSEAAKGGLAKGAQKALEKVADFYMSLADAMVPVVEISAGREVDIVFIKESKVKATKPDEDMSLGEKIANVVNPKG